MRESLQSGRSINMDSKALYKDKLRLYVVGTKLTASGRLRVDAFIQSATHLFPQLYSAAYRQIRLTPQSSRPVNLPSPF